MLGWEVNLRATKQKSARKKARKKQTNKQNCCPPKDPAMKRGFLNRDPPRKNSVAAAADATAAATASSIVGRAAAATTAAVASPTRSQRAADSSTEEFLKQMSPEEAVARTKHGGTVVCLDYPVGSTLSLDVTQWTVGDKFRGIKMLRSNALHLLHYTPVPHDAAAAGAGSAGGVAGATTGMFLQLAPGEVHALRWNFRDEDFREIPRSGAEYRGIAHSVRNFEMDKHLGVCTWGTASSNLWEKLTHCVTQWSLQRCNIQLGHHIFPGTPAETSDSKDSPMDGGKAERTGSDDGSAPGCYPQFTELEVEAPHDLVGAQLSQWHLDRSGQLEILLKHQFSANQESATDMLKGGRGPSSSKFCVSHLLLPCERLLLGEYQLSFVLLHYLQLQLALEHWKRTISLLADCATAVESHPAMFSELLATLRVQLRLVPKDFFVSPLSQGNFLEPALRRLFDNVYLTLRQQAHKTEGGASEIRAQNTVVSLKSLRARTSKLEAFVASRFVGWDYKFDGGENSTGGSVAYGADVEELQDELDALGEDAPALVFVDTSSKFGHGRFVRGSSGGSQSVQKLTQTHAKPAARMDWMLPPEDTSK